MQDVFLNLSPDLNNECSKCWAAYICGGECSYISQVVHGSYNEPVREVCDYTKALISLSISFVQKLESCYPDGYMKLKKFLLRKIFFESIVDSGLWCSVQLFKSLNIDFSYSEVMKSLVCSTYGTTPDELEKMLHSYDERICAMEVYDINEITSIRKPFIAYINKLKGSFFHEYVFVDKIADGYVYIRHFSDEIVKKLKIDIFYNEYSSIVFTLVE